MGWFSDAKSWVSNKVSSAKESIGNTISSVKNYATSAASAAFEGIGNAYNETVKFVKAVPGYTVNAVKEMGESMADQWKAAATGDIRAIFKSVSDVAGFVPLVGDALEIACAGGAAITGIIRNPSNWKGELAEFTAEAAIAALPGPKIAAKAVLMTGKNFVKQVVGDAATGAAIGAAAKGGIKGITEGAAKGAVEGGKRFAKEGAEVLGTTASKTIAEKGVARNVLRVAENVAIPGAGTFVRRSVTEGFRNIGTIVSGKFAGKTWKEVSNEVIENRAKRSFSGQAGEALAREGLTGRNSLARDLVGSRLRDVIPSSIRSGSSEIFQQLGGRRLVDLGSTVLSKSPKWLTNTGNATRFLWNEAVKDELYEAIILEPTIMNPMKKMSANILTNSGKDGEYAITVAKTIDKETGKPIDSISILNDSVNALKAHGVELPEGTKPDQVNVIPVQEFMSSKIADSIHSESLRAILKSRSNIDITQTEWKDLPKDWQGWMDRSLAFNVTKDYMEIGLEGSEQTKEGVFGSEGLRVPIIGARIFELDDETTHQHTFLFDEEKRITVPLNKESIQEYLPMCEFTGEDLYNIAREQEIEKDQEKQAQETPEKKR